LLSWSLAWLRQPSYLHLFLVEIMNKLACQKIISKIIAQLKIKL